MAMPDKRKQSLYFPTDMLQEIEDEAQRLDRSKSWIVQRAWLVARDKIAEQRHRETNRTNASR